VLAEGSGGAGGRVGVQWYPHVPPCPLFLSDHTQLCRTSEGREKVEVRLQFSASWKGKNRLLTQLSTSKQN